MTENNSLDELVCVDNECRIKAEVKYQILELESRLSPYMRIWSEQSVIHEPFISLSDALAKKYLDYVQYLQKDTRLSYFDLPPVSLLNVKKNHRERIFYLKERAFNAPSKEDEIKIIMDIASHYYYLTIRVRQEWELWNSRRCPKALMQSARHDLKIKNTTIRSGVISTDTLNYILKAYELGFNPNRLIDAVMQGYQEFIASNACKEFDCTCFYQTMLDLYTLLKTTECLTLYEYFSNQETTYLLHVLSSVHEGRVFNGITVLTLNQKNTIAPVLTAFIAVRDALRDELKRRMIKTRLYPDAPVMHPSQKKIDYGNVVRRILAIYGARHLKHGI